MKRISLLIAVAALISLLSACNKDNDASPVSSKSTIAFSIDLVDMDNGKKNSAIKNWEHPIDIIQIQLENTETGDLITEEFASIDAMIMVVPKASYNVTISTILQSEISDYIQFNAEKVINARKSLNVSMKAEIRQALLTVSNSLVVPEVNGTPIFQKQGVYYAYITDWDGKWKLGDRTITTSEFPKPGKMYHFLISDNGDIEEGIEDWDENYTSILDQLVLKEFYDIANPDGFLVTDDPSQGAVWKKSRTDERTSHEMTAIISHLLYLSGYTEVSKLGFEAHYHHIDNGNELSRASLYGLMGGYQATNNTKYKVLAQKIFPEVIVKFSPQGTHPPRNEKWGYDYINYLEGASKAVKYNLPGALEYYELLMKDYLANYKRMATDDYQRLYINAIYDRLGIGSYQGMVEWDHSYTLQDAAAGLMGDSWENPTNIKKYLINDMLKNAQNSEDLAEAIYALSL